VKKGDLVSFKKRDVSGPPWANNMIGQVYRVDKDYYGARQAFKHVGRPRGHCVNSNEVDILAPTKDGIRDRVLVIWNRGVGWDYCNSKDLTVISEAVLDVS